MNETPAGSAFDNPVAEQLPPDLTGEVPQNAEMQGGLDTPEALRAAYAGWLDRRGIDPATTPHLTMRWRELLMFSNAPPNYLDQTKELYEIPRNDQDDCQYVFLDIESDDPSQPNTPWLLTVNEADFGTIIDSDVIAKDFEEADSDPDGPLRPEGTVRMIDIGDTLAASAGELEWVTEGVMKGHTEDPFDGSHGDIGIRAGGLADGQRDAYVWTKSRVTKSVELTIAFPGTYDSVCVISGQQREAGNGKAGMAQIENPTVLLTIEGENLENLQRAYRTLYKEPDFALTKLQRDNRDATFNGYVESLISETARKNRVAEQARRDDEYRTPPLKARHLPR